MLLEGTPNEATHPAHPRTAVIYSDNQAALRTLAKGDPLKNQALICNILEAANTLEERGITLLLRWIPGHARINGNEIADSRAKQAAALIGPMGPPPIRYLSAVYGLLRQRTTAEWKRRWAQGSKGGHVRQLNAEPSRAIRTLHAGREKAHSSILTQLRTGKIGFNAFLYQRRVPTVYSPQCACGLGAMTVRHVLFTCPQWTELREEHIRPLRSTNLRTLLNSAKGCNAAVRFILRSQLLEQFKGIAREAPAIPQREASTEANPEAPHRES
jgi:hypothetical protein